MLGDGLCLERGGPPTLARDSRFGALSDEVCPQPTSPARSIRLKRSAWHDRDGRMHLDLSDDAGMENRKRFLLDLPYKLIKLNIVDIFYKIYGQSGN